MKLNLNSIFESINARRKNHVANKPLENITADEIVFAPLARKLCLKYNNGEEFDFSKFDFNHFKNNKHPDPAEEDESAIFFENLNRIIYNIVTDKLRAKPEICTPHWTFYKIETHYDTFYSLNYFKNDSETESDSDNNIFFKYFDAPVQFKLEMIPNFNFMFMDVFSNSNALNTYYGNIEDSISIGMSSNEISLKLSDINNGHLDPKGFCEFIRHLKEFLEYFTSSGFINLMEIMKSLVWLSFFVGISPDGKKHYFLTDIHMKDRDHRNYYRKYSEMKAQGWKFSSAIKMIDIIGKTNYKNYIDDLQNLPFFALNENLCRIIQPGELKSFLDRQLANDPMMRFIDSVLSENNLTNKDGIICTSIKEFMDSTNHMSFYGHPFRYELSIYKLWNEDKNAINSEYQNITAINTVDFIKYKPIMK